MTLTFQLQTPRDALAKAKREFAGLQAAVAAQDLTRIADCLYNFSVSVYHVRDWLIQGVLPGCPKSSVEAFVKATPALMACRDLCNASKHRRITQYVPITSSVLTSATSFVLTTTPPKPTLQSTAAPFRVKVKMVSGQKFDVLTLGSDALAAWNSFFSQHGI
jgi:hypothetical protein